MLRWSWSALCRGISEVSATVISEPTAETKAMLLDLQRLAYVSSSCLKLVAVYVNEIYPKPGKPDQPHEAYCRVNLSPFEVSLVLVESSYR